MKKFTTKIIQKILKTYAIRVIAQFSPKIIAITGTVGKTTTKNAVYAVLKQELGDKVRANGGNLNNEIGIPLTILGYEKMPKKFEWFSVLFSGYFANRKNNYPEYLILEMGVDAPGDISYYSEIVKPDYVIITSATAAHLANFSSQEEYQKEKISLLSSVIDKSRAFINLDDDFLAKNSSEGVVTVGVENTGADYLADNIKIGRHGTDFRINRLGRKIAVKSKLLGRQLIYGQLFAFALADKMGLSLLKAGEALTNIEPTPGRMSLIEGKNHVLIIDDTYNSNPSSARAAIDALSEMELGTRKVIVLGNMNELGESEKREHYDIGSYAKGKCDFAIFSGPNAEEMAKGFGKENCLIVKNRQSLEGEIERYLKKDDIVLVKASQNGNFFEEIVKKLMLNPEKASELLVRQGPLWNKKKGLGWKF